MSNVKMPETVRPSKVLALLTLKVSHLFNIIASEDPNGDNRQKISDSTTIAFIMKTFHLFFQTTEALLHSHTAPACVCGKNYLSQNQSLEPKRLRLLIKMMICSKE